jgi:hypothetical protein
MTFTLFAVGSFVWSHLHNLLKSSSPSKVEIQALLQDKDRDSKFSSDVRKYSHNYEGSMFFENYNFGRYVYRKLKYFELKECMFLLKYI